MKKSSFSIGIFGDIWYATTGVVVMQREAIMHKNQKKNQKFNVPISKINPHFLLLDVGLLTQSVSFLLE